MPSNKKKKQQKRRGGGRPSGPNAKRDPKPTAGPWTNSFEHPIGTKPDASWPRRMTMRPTPTTLIDGGSRGQWRAAALAVPEAERTPTAERFATAYKLVDEVEAFLEGYEKPTPPQDSDVGGNPIGALVCDYDFIRACGKLIRVVVLSNQRVYYPKSVIKKMIKMGCMNQISNQISNLTPLGETSVQQPNMPAWAFVVFLANAFLFANARPLLGGKPVLTMVAKRVVHELHAHVQGGYDWLDWSELDELGCDWLTEDLCRFAMATIGVEVSRDMYRLGSDARRSATSTGAKLSTRRLLNDVEAFAKEQCRLRPACGVGYRNLGWVAGESPSRRNANGLAAAAECYRLFTKTYEIADAESDDFLSASARIEAAGMLVLGGGGMVGFWTHQVQRNFCSAFASTNGGTTFRPVGISALTRQDFAAAQANERRRVKEGVPITTLEPGETLLVEWWVVLKLWNEAMVFYDAVWRFGHGGIVYSESSMWDNCAKHLKFWMDDQRLDMDAMEYARGPMELGIPKERDRGIGFNECDFCGEESANKTCTGCKHMQYCSAECQRADWKRGHKKECDKLAALLHAFASQS